MKLICGVASLLTGATIYLLFRSKSLLGFAMLNRIGVEPWVNRLRNCTAGVNLPEVIIFALPGGLWALSYILIIDSIIGKHSRSTRLFWASVIPLLGIGSELLQAFGILPGTFDLWDLVCYTLPYIIYLIVI